MQHDHNAIQHWWDDEPGRKYWMEFVKEINWGRRLYAPASKGYRNMHEVKEGDVIFHWLSERHPSTRWNSGIGGWSIVDGPARPTSETWEGQQCNMVPLRGRKVLDQILSLKRLQTRAEELLTIRAAIRSSYPRPHWIAFDPSKNGIKPHEGYLWRLPREMVTVLESEMPGFDPGDGDRGALPLSMDAGEIPNRDTR